MNTLLSHTGLQLCSIRHGIVCFTFDDARYNEWLPLLPVFQSCHASCTFFFSGAIDAPALAAMKELRANGHSVGLHTQNHRNAPEGIAETGIDAYIAQSIQPQLDACRDGDFPVDLLAYPNNHRTPETDRIFHDRCGFRRYRAGLASHPPIGFRIADQDDAFLPLDKVPEQTVFGGCGIGSYYASTQENLDSALERAARDNTLLTFFSHGISDHPDRVDVSLSMLEATFRKANELGLAIVGLDDLPWKEESQTNVPTK